MEVTGRLYIDGEWKTGKGSRFEQRNPARLSELTGTWPEATTEELDEALSAANSAFEAWSRVPAQKRADVLTNALRAIEARRDELAAILTAENGKTLKESRSEIQSGFREMEYQIGEGVRLNGKTTPSINEGVLSYDVRRPLGVVSVISPWNFPFNVPCRKITPALMAGNTVLFKPSSLTPQTGQLFVELMEEAGLPAGVLNFVTGRGSTVGNALVSSPQIRAVSFTGSTEVGKRLHQKASEHMIKTQLEMGGKNPLVVLRDADLDAVAEAAVVGAFTCAGQWCTATSRLIVEEPVYDEVIERVVSRASELIVGDGGDSSVTMGPVCGLDQLDNVMKHIKAGTTSGAKLAMGGRRIEDKGFADGCFIEPTLFVDVEPEMELAREEIFGPVLSVLKASDIADAITKANDTDFGLTSSIYTRDVQSAMRFVSEIATGFTHINLMTAYREPQHSFGGIKDSGFGLPEAGSTGIEFFTEHKVVYISRQ